MRSFVAISILGLFLIALPARANDIYMAQGGAGGGTSCANPVDVGFFNNAANWGTGSNQIGPGTTVHLCGTTTTSAGACSFFKFLGSGTSGSPIKLLFEANAILQANYLCNLSSDGTINTNGKSYVTVDLGSNGVVQATAN